MKHAELITIGSLTFDIFVKPLRHEIIKHCSDHEIKEYLAFPYGEKIRTEEVHECFGGGAANVGIGFSRQGIATAVIGAIGNEEWGKLVIQNLKKEKIDYSMIQNAKEKTGFSIILNSYEGDRTVLAYAGANHAIETINPSLLKKVAGIHLCHLSGKSAKIFDILKTYYAKNPKKFLSWNPGKEQLEKGIRHYKEFLPVVDVLIINREEAEEFTGIKCKLGSAFGPNTYDMKKLMQNIYNRGFKSTLVITDGRRGAQASNGKKNIFCAIDETLPRIDTLGAGDAFASGFSTAIFQKKDLITAIKSGTINAGRVISAYGAQTGLLTKKELLKELKHKKLHIQEKKFSY